MGETGGKALPSPKIALGQWRDPCLENRGPSAHMVPNMLVRLGSANITVSQGHSRPTAHALASKWWAGLDSNQ
jgi:hypothetical protein